MTTSTSTVTFHPCSLIHMSVPLIRHSESEEWPRGGQSLHVRVSNKAYFFGKPTCQLAAASANESDILAKPEYWFLGVCAEYMSDTNEIVSVGTTIRFVSVAISGLAYAKDNIKLVTAKSQRAKVLTC